MIAALLSRFWGYLAAAGAALVALWAYGASRKAEGRKETYIEALRDSVKRQEAGKHAVQDLRGADRDDLADRVRANDSRWD